MKKQQAQSEEIPESKSNKRRTQTKSKPISRDIFDRVDAYIAFFYLARTLRDASKKGHVNTVDALAPILEALAEAIIRIKNQTE